MIAFCQNLLTTSVHGSIIILAVMLLRAVLKRTPRKYICYLWMLAFIRLLVPVALQSPFSLQPGSVTLPAISSYVPLILWACVAAVLAGVSTAAYFHLRQQVKDAVKVPGGYASDKIETAFVLGFIKPKIYIPQGMSKSTCKQILAHERTHLEKGDHWLKLIAFVALAMHWFNPLVWAAYVMLCKDIEIACDERVVQFMELGERKAYSSALLQCSTNHVHYAACPVAFGEISVKYRIQSVLSYRKPTFLVSLLGVLAVIFVCLCLFTNPAEANSDSESALTESSHQTPSAVTLADAPETDANPDWGITVCMDVTSPTGGHLAVLVSEDFIVNSESMQISNMRIDFWNGTDWEQVSGTDQAEGMSGYTIGFAKSRNYSISDYGEDLDWTYSCGSLAAGDYRIVFDIAGEQDTATFQAGFHIYREQLPTEEEDALTRCTNALNAVSGSGSYSVLISEESPAGNIQPVKLLTSSHDTYSVSYYYGEFLVSSCTGSNAGYALNDWADEFSLNQNRKFLFPEGESTISQEEITFRSVWADYDGTVHYGTDTFCFETDGTLKSIDRLDETIGDDGTVTSRQRTVMEVQGLSEYTVSVKSTYEPEDSYIAQQQSAWGIFFRVDDDLLTGKGGEVWLSVDAIGVSNYTTDGSYWLEKREGDQWVRLGDDQLQASWGEETIPLVGSTTIRTIDWSETYGTLSAGVYRMGKYFYKGTESTIQYAEFSVPLTGGVFGEGAEEALARINEAIAALQQKGFRMEMYSSADSQYYSDSSLDEVIWRYGDEEVYDFYTSEGYSHSALETAEDAIFFNSWADYGTSNDQGSFYFAEDYTVISDTEIRFAYGYSQSASSDPIYVYTFLFDEDGNLIEIDKSNREADDGWLTRYVVTDTSESEIQAWVEKIKAES